MVFQVDEISDVYDGLRLRDGSSTNCLICFYKGTEYKIQGIYESNRYNWRWSQK